MYCARCQKDIIGTPLMTSDNRMFCPNCVDEMSVTLSLTAANMEKFICSELLIADGKTDEGIAACRESARSGNPYAAINLGYYYENKSEYLFCWNEWEKKWNAFFWYDVVALGDDAYRAMRGVSDAQPPVSDKLTDRALRNVYSLLCELRGDMKVRFGEFFPGVTGDPAARVGKVVAQLGKRLKETQAESTALKSGDFGEDLVKILFEKFVEGNVVIGGVKLSVDLMKRLIDEPDDKYIQVLVKYNFVFAAENGNFMAVINVRDFREKMRRAVENNVGAYLCYLSKDKQKLTQVYKEGKTVLARRKVTIVPFKRFQEVMAIKRKNLTDLRDFTADDFIVARFSRQTAERNTDKFVAIDFLA